MSFVHRLAFMARMALVGLVVLAGAAPLRAQTTSASVSGIVNDAQGGLLPGATVTLTSRTQGNSLHVHDRQEGRFVFADRPARHLHAQVTMQGFKTLERTNVVVSANDRLSAGHPDPRASGAIEESVTVSEPRQRAADGERRALVHAGERDDQEHRQQRAVPVQLRHPRAGRTSQPATGGAA